MANTLQSLLTFGALGITGDVAGLTCFNTKHGRTVMYLAAPPKEPPSVAQTTMRNRWRQAFAVWRAMPDSTRSNWKRAARGAHLSIGATALWLWFQLYDDRATIKTIERQSGVTLL